MVDLPSAAWRKSAYSNANSCVEVPFVEGQVAVRDSKDRILVVVLLFDSHEWEAFVGGVQSSEFDLLRWL